MRRGAGDDSVVDKALKENWILITSDKDFGEKIYKEGRPHKGVILLRLEDERPTNKVAVLKKLLESYANKLPGEFVVVSEKQVRFARKG